MAGAEPMTRDAIQAKLTEVGDAVRARFPVADSQRRAQFDSHLATVQMIVGHLFDEADRNEQ